MSRIISITLACAMLLGCASDGDETKASSVQPLDATKKQFGKTFAEWATEWILYVNAYEKPTCANPLQDDTGEYCAVDQDPELPVFFLVGTFGGVVKRVCNVPKDKALFLPLANIWGDNAGVPDDMLLSDDDLRSYVETSFVVEPKRLYLRVDGEDIEGIDEGLVKSAPYTIDLKPDVNAYECANVKGVEGKFDGYVGGYWVMLPALEPGTHDLEFGIKEGPNPQTGDPSSSYSIDIKYELHVE